MSSSPSHHPEFFEIRAKQRPEQRIVARTECDANSYKQILERPWLSNNVLLGNNSWGKRLADVTLIGLPQYLVAQVLIVPSDENEPDNSPLIKDEVTLVVHRWDRREYLGWEEPFTITMEFTDSGPSLDVVVPRSSALIDEHSMTVRLQPDTQVRERINQSHRTIPRTIFNVSRNLIKNELHIVRRLIRNVRVVNATMQCTSMCVIIEDDVMMKEIEYSGIPDFLEACNALRSGSYRADIMRYYLLYKYGGIYHDDKSILRYSLDSAAFDDLLGDTDFMIGVFGPGEPDITFMAARAGSPIMLKALETSISHVMSRYYGSGEFDITGNAVIRILLEEEGRYLDPKRANEKFKVIQPPTSEDDIAVSRLEVFGERVKLVRIENCLHRILWKRTVMWHRCAIPYDQWPKPASHYRKLWPAREVYIDGNPPAPIVPHDPTNRRILAIALAIGGVVLLAMLLTKYPML